MVERHELFSFIKTALNSVLCQWNQLAEPLEKALKLLMGSRPGNEFQYSLSILKWGQPMQSIGQNICNFWLFN